MCRLNSKKMANVYKQHGSAQSSQESFTDILLRPWSFASETSLPIESKRGKTGVQDEVV